MVGLHQKRCLLTLDGSCISNFFIITLVEKLDSEDVQDAQPTQEEDTQGVKYYDKAKCFFDNISADLKPR